EDRGGLERPCGLRTRRWIVGGIGGGVGVHRIIGIGRIPGCDWQGRGCWHLDHYAGSLPAATGQRRRAEEAPTAAAGGAAGCSAAWTSACRIRSLRYQRPSLRSSASCASTAWPARV